jgi:hypothetical protein
MIVQLYCSICTSPLTVGDIDGLCKDCEQRAVELKRAVELNYQDIKKHKELIHKKILKVFYIPGYGISRELI